MVGAALIDAMDEKLDTALAVGTVLVVGTVLIDERVDRLGIALFVATEDIIDDMLGAALVVGAELIDERADRLEDELGPELFEAVAVGLGGGRGN